ncbi:hypothetical protein [Streptomyces xanthophaeus]|uniref:hypothetical protein n=1 Tax=Streptomyces xanthophaeus TaxID=67385 RepID=UPI00233F51A1|nr:hypothetical protein [Streptomyces xanthophaeus]
MGDIDEHRPAAELGEDRADVTAKKVEVVVSIGRPSAGAVPPQVGGDDPRPQRGQPRA